MKAWIGISNALRAAHAPGGGARSGSGRHPAPSGAADRWLAREAPDALARTVRPNPSIERTSTGRPHLALISFWAKCVPPVPAAHVKR